MADITIEKIKQDLETAAYVEIRAVATKVVTAVWMKIH